MSKVAPLCVMSGLCHRVWFRISTPSKLVGSTVGWFLNQFLNTCFQNGGKFTFLNSFASLLWLLTSDVFFFHGGEGGDVLSS